MTKLAASIDEELEKSVCNGGTPHVFKAICPDIAGVVVADMV